MHPGFRVTAIGSAKSQDITYNINTRLLMIEVCDQPGLVSDRFSIHLDDRPPYIDLPLTGEKMKVELGYVQVQNNIFPSPMKHVGTFVLDELEIEKQRGGRMVSLTGHAWDTESPFKQQRTLSYHNKKLGDILQAIARRNGWTLTCTADLGNKMVKQADQKGVSDAGFLDDLSGQYNALYKIFDDKLFFSDPDELYDLIDQQQGGIIIYDTDVLSFRYLTQGRGRYTAVRAKYHDKDKTGELKFVVTMADETAARKEVYYEIPETFPSEEEATAAALNQKERFDKSQATINFSCIGTPELLSDGLVNLAGFRPDIPTAWRIEKVHHRLTPAGYICEVEAGMNLPHKRKRKQPRPRLRPIR